MPSVSKFHKDFARAALKHQAHKNGWAAAEGFLAADAGAWITIHPNGKGPKADGSGNKKGRRVKIDPQTGEVLKGLGGKFNGRHLSEVKSKNSPQQPEQAAHVILRGQLQRSGRLDDIQELGKQQRQNAALTKQLETQRQEAQSSKQQAKAAAQGQSKAESENASLKERIAQLEAQLKQQQESAAQATAQSKEQLKAEVTEELRQQQNQPKKQQINLELPERIAKDIVLQNRSRSNKASVEQMESIARSLDYYRVGTSNDFNSGSPVISFGQYDSNCFGNKETLVMANGKHLDVQYAVVEAGDVLTSHNAHGSERSEYFSDDPSKKRAIAGNGRMAAIQLSYRSHKEQAAKYKQALLDNAAKHGCSPDVISSMQNPVLVRIMQPKDVTKDIGDQTNITQGMELNAVEQSRTDSKRMDVAQFQTYEDGSPTLESVRKFISALPKTEQAGLLTADGKPSRQAQDRLQNAMMMAGYDNEHLVRLRGQAINPEGKNMLSALCNAATKFAPLKESGNYGAEGKDGYDMSNIINAVVQGFTDYRDHGKGSDFKWERDLEMNDAQNKAAKDIAELVNANKRSSLRLTQIFKTIGTHLNEAYEFKQKAFSSWGLGAGLGMEDLDMRNDVKSPQQALKEALTEVKADFERKDREKLEAAARRERNSNPLLAGLGFGDSAQNIAGLLPRCNKRQRKAIAYALGRLVADRMLA